MQKKLLAVALSGVLVFGAGMSVFAADAVESAADAAESEADAFLSEEDGELDALLGGLMSSLGDEEADLDGLLSSLGVDEENAGELLGMVLGGLSEAGGDLDGLLDSVMGGLATDETEGEGFELDDNTLNAVTDSLGIDLSSEDISGLMALLNDPESAKQMFSGLFEEGGIGATILDMIGSKDNALGTVVGSMKDDDGGYDIDKIVESLQGVKESGDGIEIDGTEISAEDLNDTFNDVLGAFGLAGEDETEAA